MPIHLSHRWVARYRATKKLQRLRFIRRLLVDRGYRELKLDHHEEDGSKSINNNNVKDDSRPHGAANGSQQTASQLFVDEFNVYLRKESSRDLYTREILGYSTDEDVENMFLNALQMGPEQTAVYSLELAKVSAEACVLIEFLRRTCKLHLVHVYPHRVPRFVVHMAAARNRYCAPAENNC